MLNFGNKEFRNLQEQVLENMKNIKSLQDLSLVGINVDYIVEDLSSIQSPEAGQMAAVGAAAPYTLYVYYNSSWVSFGEFPKEGPQGPAGADGLMIEVHDKPDESLCDKNQAISIEELTIIINKIKKLNK